MPMFSKRAEFPVLKKFVVSWILTKAVDYRMLICIWRCRVSELPNLSIRVPLHPHRMLHRLRYCRQHRHLSFRQKHKRSAASLSITAQIAPSLLETFQWFPCRGRNFFQTIQLHETLQHCSSCFSRLQHFISPPLIAKAVFLIFQHVFWLSSIVTRSERVPPCYSCVSFFACWRSAVDMWSHSALKRTNRRRNMHTRWFARTDRVSNGPPGWHSSSLREHHPLAGFESFDLYKWPMGTEKERVNAKLTSEQPFN